MAYMPNFVWSSGLKVTVFFVMLMSRGGFKCNPETKFQTITS